MIAGFHGHAISQMGNADLVACFDVAHERVGNYSKEWGCTGYSDTDEFLAHPGLEIVILSTPSGLHLVPALAALRAGHHRTV